jgi:hypothetical protein
LAALSIVLLNAEVKHPLPTAIKKILPCAGRTARLNQLEHEGIRTVLGNLTICVFGGLAACVVAAQADAIMTRNLRDVSRGELKFPSLRVLTPEQCLEVFPCPR